MPRPSSSRRFARQASELAADGKRTTANRTIAAYISIAHAILELAYQVGRLADQVPVYGPPEETDE